MYIFQSSIGINIPRFLSPKLPYKKLNFLNSYGVKVGDENELLKTERSLTGSKMADCGTFSLHKEESESTANISFSGYRSWITEFGHEFDYYPTYDVNFTENGFEENLYYLKLLEKEGLSPFPVIHNFYNNEIDYYIEHGYKFVALGSIMEEGSTKQLRTEYDIAHAVNRLSPHNIKIHLFGSSSYNILANLPLFSSDSSSWTQFSKFGEVLFWNPYRDQEDKTDIISFEDHIGEIKDGRTYFREYEYQIEFESYLEKTLGITYDHLMGQDYNFYRKVVNSAYYLQIEDVITEKHHQLGFSS